MDSVDLFWRAGSLHGRMPLLAPNVRAATDLALVDLVWKAYVRDAGPGDVGPLFSGWKHPDHVLLSEDPRAGAVLSWVSSREGPLRHGAQLLHDARGRSGTRFCAAEKDMLAESLAAFAHHGVVLNAAPPIENLMTAVETLRDNARFLSDRPGGGGYTGGAWAINLALTTISTPAPQPGIVTRELLRTDTAPDREILLRSWSAAVDGAYKAVQQVAERLRRIAEQVDTFSRNARAREVVGALAALNVLRRQHVKRGWHLSDAGTTLVVRQLAELGLGSTSQRGMVWWLPSDEPAPLEISEEDEWEGWKVAAEFDEAMAFADRVLARYDGADEKDNRG